MVTTKRPDWLCSKQMHSLSCSWGGVIKDWWRLSFDEYTVCRKQFEDYIFQRNQNTFNCTLSSSCNYDTCTIMQRLMMEPVGPVLTFLDFCGTISRVFKKKRRHKISHSRTKITSVMLKAWTLATTYSPRKYLVVPESDWSTLNWKSDIVH